MASKRDYYEILSVPRNASGDEIKKAYRKCAMSHHPDRNPGDKRSEEKFKEATEAYQVLSTPEKRQMYDQFGHAGVEASGHSTSGFSAGGFSDIFEDIFEDFFSTVGGSASGGGGKSRRARPQRGNDLAIALEITFEESAFGCEKTLDLKREESCATCKGEGARPGTSHKTCSTCRGSGQVMASSGFFSISRPCPHCHGQGNVIEYPCADCRGAGRVIAAKKIQAKVPAGVDNGNRLRIPGEGEAGFRGGPHGDLYAEIRVHPHEIFTREGDNIICEVPVSMVEAALGCEIQVPTIAGPTKLKVPAGTQNGRSFKLKSKGFPSLRGAGLGDEEIRVIVETPAHLSEEQIDLLKKFAVLSGEKVNPATYSFMNKVKKIFSK